MSPFTVTLESSEHMPRHQGLLQRGTRWYANFKVPNDLRKALGKSHIRESLGTSDYREACRKIAYERARVTACFENERRKLRAAFPPEIKTKKTALTVISKREAFQMSIRYLASLEHEFKTWIQEEGRFLEPHKREEILSTLAGDARELAEGTEFRGQPLDGTFELQSFLQAEGWNAPFPALQKQRGISELLKKLGGIMLEKKRQREKAAKAEREAATLQTPRVLNTEQAKPKRAPLRE